MVDQQVQIGETSSHKIPVKMFSVVWLNFDFKISSIYEEESHSIKKLYNLLEKCIQNTMVN